MSTEQKVNGPKAAAPLPKTYVEWQDAFPGGASTVRIVFHGLFGFFFNDRKCFVGTHNTTRQPGHPHTDHPHEYKVTISQRDAGILTGFLPYEVNTGNPLEVPVLDIDVAGSAFPGGKAPGVYVYTGLRHAQFSRSPGDDEKDWRWIIDFEDKVYPMGVQGKIWEAMQPGVTINNGLFHTDLLTHAQFDLVPEGGGAAIPLNSIAHMVAANIYLAPGGTVHITGGPVGDLLLEYKKNRTFEVFVSNLCDGDIHPPCDYQPDAGSKEGRNDFFLHYETFNPALNKPEYMLVKRETPVDGLLRTENFISDDSPCGSVGYGGTPPP